MPDVLDNERGPTPPWVAPVAVLAAIAVVVSLAWRSGRLADAGPAARPASASPKPSPSPSPLPTPQLAGNACGGEVEQPLINGGPVPPNTKLRILVGDRDLRSLDVDTGELEVMATRKDGRSFTQLAQTATQVLAVLRDPCTVDGYGHGLLAAVDPVDGEVTTLGAGEAVLPGEPPSVLDIDAAGAMSVGSLGTRRRTSLPDRWELYARTSGGYFASIGASDDAPPDVGVGSPINVRLTKTFGRGTVVGASPELLFWLAGDCPGDPCLLTWTTADGVNTAQAIDTFGWGGVVSPDGTKMAFRKQRASGQLGDHPGPPNDIAVLDRTRHDGSLTVLPDLVLPAKAGLTMTWSPDSQWLVIGADLGTGPAVLLWRDGMERPAWVPLPPTGGGTTGPPALLVLPR